MRKQIFPLLIIIILSFSFSFLLTNVFYVLGFSLIPKNIFHFLSFVTLFIIIFYVFYKKTQWVLESFSKSYGVFNYTYLLYRKQVVKEGKTYEAFIRDVKSLSFEDVSKSVAGKLSDLLDNRRDLLDKYYSKDHFRYTDFEGLMRDIDTTYPTADIESDLARKLEKVRERIALCYSRKNGLKMHEGERMFGFILKEKHFSKFDKESREDAFKRFMRGEVTQKSKSCYFGNPYYDRIGKTKRSISKTNEILKNINSFFKGIDLEVTVFENDNKTL